MRNVRLRMSLLCLAAIAGFSASVPPANGGEPASATTLVTLRAADPCGFHRSEAFGRGLTHYATEMLWACEAIADRRAASMPLGDRLAVLDVALAAYREAVIAAGRRAFAERRDRGVLWNAQADGSRETRPGRADGRAGRARGDPGRV